MPHASLCEMIYKRKSCRSYTGTPVEQPLLDKIMSFVPRPLYPKIQVRMDIVRRDQVKCICPWTTPQLIAIYSEKKDGWLENAGFLFQQMDLYLQNLGLGACWLGMGRMDSKSAPKADGMEFVILLAFGYPKGDQLRHGLTEFKRKTLAQIADFPDTRLESARLAPSSINSQPWYFTHQDDAIHVYCVRKGLSGYMNRIDVGIALAHLYVANEETFRFFTAESPTAVSGYSYIGSVTL